MNRPLGVTFLGAIHVVGGIFSLFAALWGFSFFTVGLFNDATMAAIGGLFLVWFGILTAINWGIASALFSGKPWGRAVILVLSIIGLIFGIVAIIGGNISSIFTMIINGIVIWYLGRPHVIEYFYGKTS